MQERVAEEVNLTGGQDRRKGADVGTLPQDRVDVLGDSPIS